MFSIIIKARAEIQQRAGDGWKLFMNHESEVNVDRIMRKIREDVAKRKQKRSATAASSELLAPEEHDAPVISQRSFIPHWIKKSLPWKALKDFNAQLKRIELYQKWYSRLYSRLERMAVPPDGIYYIEDFLKYQDREFITSAYSVLMGSEPSRDRASEMLSELKNGSKGKIDIIWDLRNSSQGKKKNIRIKGLALRYAKWKLLKF